ncbi:MAG: DUF6186 family protein [Actinomycetota bacterium]|nr:DUF6186 family protein [Actinomycetota bacterium]
MMLPPDSRTLILVIWAVLFGALALWQLICLLHPRLPSLTVVVDLVMTNRITRWLLLAGWFWWGWHVWVRGGW